MFGGSKFFIAHNTLNGNTGTDDARMSGELEILVKPSTGGWIFPIHVEIFLLLEDSRGKNCCLNQSQVSYDFLIYIKTNPVQSEVASFPSVSTFFTTVHKPDYHTQCVTVKIIPALRIDSLQLGVEFKYQWS